MGQDTIRKLTLRKTLKRNLLVIEKHVDDVKQDEKSVPDLLESIMSPTDPVKEELRRNLIKMCQFESKIPKIKVSTFWILELQSFPGGGQCQPARR